VYLQAKRKGRARQTCACKYRIAERLRGFLQDLEQPLYSAAITVGEVATEVDVMG
jgi:hypothetical protein